MEIGSVSLEPWWLVKAALAGIGFGLAARFFCSAQRGVAGILRRIVPNDLVRPVFGGALVIGLFFLAGTPDYLGLGVDSRNPAAVTILSFFERSTVHTWSWLWKLTFTVLTLASGFKGGEVTPLFFIGAALGNALSPFLGIPTDLAAALGFAAVFSGAAKTPFTGILMGVELFGIAPAAYLAAACLIASRVSGYPGVYTAQRAGGSLTRLVDGK